MRNLIGGPPRVGETEGGPFRRLTDWIFGYDFFISYAHADGGNYPAELHARLEEIGGYKAFLDKTEFVPGIDLRRATRRRVRMSQKLVVVARPSALQSEWVHREVEIHLAAGDQGLASSAAEKAADLEDPPGLVFLVRGMARQKLGDYQGQVEDFKKALELAPELFSEEERRKVSELVKGG